MTEDAQRLLAKALVEILRPLIRILLRNGVTYRAFTETAKSVYVEIASGDFGIPGRKQTDSRVSVITGLSRKEVKRVKSMPIVDSGDNLVRYNRAARVIQGWIQDRDFMDDQGEPADLPLDDSPLSFAELVRRYSGDAPPRAVLDELEQVGAVERLDDGRLNLLTRGYIPQTDSPDRIGILGVSVSDLLKSINHNLKDETMNPHFQRIVVNERIPTGVTGEFQDLTRLHGQQFLEKLDRWLSEHEQRKPAEDGQELSRVGVGVYFFEEPGGGE